MQEAPKLELPYIPPALTKRLKDAAGKNRSMLKIAPKVTELLQTPHPATNRQHDENVLGIAANFGIDISELLLEIYPDPRKL